jgi:hypothetical protein
MSTFINKVLCVGLRTSCLGTTAQDREATEEVLAKNGAQRGSMRVTKSILTDAIKPARQRRAAARKWFNSVTLPGVSDDLRITTPARLADIQKEITRIRDEDYDWLMNVLIPNYDRYKDDDRIKLNGAFDPSLYPEPQDLHQHFQVILTVTDMPQGDWARVQGLDAAARQQMEDQYQKMVGQIGTQARNEVMRKMAQLISHIAEKLGNPDAKAFHESTFTNLKEYLAIVPDLNITMDPQLEAIRKEAAERLDYSMKMVKDSEFLKEQAASAAKDILKKFGAIGTGRKLVA